MECESGTLIGRRDDAQRVLRGISEPPQQARAIGVVHQQFEGLPGRQRDDRRRIDLLARLQAEDRSDRQRIERRRVERQMEFIDPRQIALQCSSADAEMLQRVAPQLHARHAVIETHHAV
ncbi:hypothetical protein DBR17_16210 [Sphingomonas sp. HMWF008]|nr:hypothetical protein DBR17_16210 [Sphingomonas sp. HMWF008]